jgi:hypothetical protein
MLLHVKPTASLSGLLFRDLNESVPAAMGLPLPRSQCALSLGLDRQRRGSQRILFEKEITIRSTAGASSPPDMASPITFIAILVDRHHNYPTTPAICTIQLSTMSNDSSGSSDVPGEAGQGYGTLNLIHAIRQLIDNSADAPDSGAPAEAETPFPRRSTEEVERDAYVLFSRLSIA